MSGSPSVLRVLRFAVGSAPRPADAPLLLLLLLLAPLQLQLLPL
jgi:hypothetical protein